MALSFTVSQTHSIGDIRKINGTFTGAIGDNSGTLDKTVHGCGVIVDYRVSMDGAIGAFAPQATITADSIALVFDDLSRAVTGTWIVEGK